MKASAGVVVDEERAGDCDESDYDSSRRPLLTRCAAVRSTVTKTVLFESRAGALLLSSGPRPLLLLGSRVGGRLAFVLSARRE